QARDLALERFEPLLAAARQAARGAARSRLQHRHPGVLVAEIVRQIYLVRRLDIEERLGPVLDRDLRDLERVNQLVAAELEARRRDFPGKGAVLVALHLHGVDLHDRERTRLPSSCSRLSISPDKLPTPGLAAALVVSGTIRVHLRHRIA